MSITSYKPRILHITTRIAGGGACENILLSVNGFNKERYSVDLAIGEESETALIEQYGLDPSVTLFIIPSLRRKPSPLHEIIALRNIRNIIRKRKYDIIHTHGAKAGILGRIAAKKERVSHIINGIHGITFSQEMGFLTRHFYKWIERRTGKYTDKFISVGADIRDKYIHARIGKPEQYVIIHSGMDIARFRTHMSKQKQLLIRKELGIPKHATIIANISRLEPRKGFHYFIEAAKNLASKDLCFLIVGEGPEYSRLQTLAARYNLESIVIFTGYQKYVEHIFAISDIIVLTSLWEGLPRVLVQAAISGTPAVTFDVEGAKEIIKNNINGYIVSMKDITALTNRIRYLIENPKLRMQMGAAAKQCVDDRWSVASMVQQLETTYQDLLRRG